VTAPTTPLQLEIISHLRSYLSGEIDANAFREWFLGETWEIDGTDDEAAKETSYEIELRFAEYSNGDWSEHEFKDLLRSLVEHASPTASA
jgi:hypothetical protein